MTLATIAPEVPDTFGRVLMGVLFCGLPVLGLAWLLWWSSRPVYCALCRNLIRKRPETYVIDEKRVQLCRLCARAIDRKKSKAAIDEAFGKGSR